MQIINKAITFKSEHEINKNEDPMSKLGISITLFICLIMSSNAYNIPGLFSFGDSTMDPGNNNDMKTDAKANFLPYGKDLPKHVPTGRFCNGKLVTDYIASALNLSDFLPAYAGHVVSVNDFGVSFASAASGLDDWTSKSWNVTAMSDQIQQFIEYIGKMKVVKGDAATLDFIKKSIFIISIGSNDFMLNYYLIPLRSVMYTVQQYNDFLLGRLKIFLQQLHALGVRNFLIGGLPPIGCVPLQMSLDAVKSGPFTVFPKIMKPKCSFEKNDVATNYNIKLQQMLQNLRNYFNSIEKSKVDYIDIYYPILEMATNPAQYGFKETTRGCCGTGVAELGPFCRNLLPTCRNPSEYLFWDAVHPTQAAYEVIANMIMEKSLPNSKLVV